MLELCKQILEKVSFDKYLFQKELRKSISWIQNEEMSKFRSWVFTRFGKMYPDVVESAFVTIKA